MCLNTGSDAEIGEGIPITYVPARNTVFLSYALALAETTGANGRLYRRECAWITLGIPIARPEFVAAFRDRHEPCHQGRRRGGAARLKLHTPLIDMTKAEIVRKKAPPLASNYGDIP